MKTLKKNHKHYKSMLSFISKTMMKNLALLPLLFFTLLFTGCQEEVNEIILGSEEEEILGTDPGNPDTDGDGYDDGEEVNELESNPLGLYSKF